MSPVRGAFVGVLLACLLSGGAAGAQSNAASAAAEKLFREGKAHFAAQRYEQAIEKFRASQELEPSVGVLLSLGDAYRARGKIASAWSAYTSARDLAKTKGDARVTDAEERAAEVSPRLSRLTIRVASPSDVSVTDNGLALPSASFGSPLPVDPGPHEIVATAKGRRPFHATESLAEGQAREIAVPVLEWDDDARSVTPPAAGDGRGDTQRTVGTSLLLGGGAVTVVGLVFGGLALSKWNTVSDACPDRLCDTTQQRAAVQGDARTADRFAVASTVTVGIGLVAIAAGLVLRMTAPSKSSALTTGFGGRGLVLGASFQ